MIRRPLGLRAKLILIFIFIKVLPLVALAWFAGREIHHLGLAVEDRTAAMISDTSRLVGEVGRVSTENSIQALDMRSREAIERLTTDTARAVAEFLYDRDRDIRHAAALPAEEKGYREFLSSHTRTVIQPLAWGLNADGTEWVPLEQEPAGPTVVCDVEDNKKDFHSRPPESKGRSAERPLYLEMTFVGLDGMERVKVSTSDILPRGLRDVSRRENTWCRAEDYFRKLRDLGPGEIHVSEVIGAYVGSPIIGPYTPDAARKAGIPFEPEKAAYAGKENPVGRRFQAIIRWAIPVYKDGRRLGYVTLALDHTHVMEFTDHLLPTEERYTTISDAYTGNYAFIWDHKDRCISHPRDYFITGYDPKTGEPAVPWLDEEIHQLWRTSKKGYSEFIKTAPEFLAPSLKRGPAPELTRAGLLGLDGRYLNFAPQCAGWHTLTRHGGSGSFVIYWSGLWKLTTAASIPYHTGMYKPPKGFGYVTIGANVDDFHKAATDSARQIDALVTGFKTNLEEQKQSTLSTLSETLGQTIRDLSVSTGVMIVLVIVIAIWMASTLTRRITGMIRGIRAFQEGDMSRRLEVRSGDEMGQLASAFNEMCDTILESLNSARVAENKYRTIFENALEGIYQSTPEGRFVRVNPAMAQLFGFDSPAQMIEAVTDIKNQLYVSPERRDEYIRLLLAQGEVNGFEAETRRRDGSTFWGQLNARAVFDAAGNVLYTEGLLQDISARKLVEASLKNAKEAAETASQMKTHFLSVVSHELRTPLTSIAGFVKIIKKKLSGLLFPLLESADAKASRDMQQVATDLDIVIAEGERLTSLINDVLDLTKLEAGRMEWGMRKVSPADVLARAEASMRILVSGSGLGFVVDVQEGLPMVRADPDRLQQVLINLVSNAVKFTAQGAITCSARLQGREILVAVADTGAGIAQEHRDSVFDKFWQFGDLLTEKPKGTGLGLAICKEIVAHHGGRIWVESELDKGSVFTFTLPVETS